MRSGSKRHAPADCTVHIYSRLPPTPPPPSFSSACPSPSFNLCRPHPSLFPRRLLSLSAGSLSSRTIQLGRPVVNQSEPVPSHAEGRRRRRTTQQNYDPPTTDNRRPPAHADGTRESRRGKSSCHCAELPSSPLLVAPARAASAQPTAPSLSSPLPHVAFSVCALLDLHPTRDRAAAQGGERSTRAKLCSGQQGAAA